MTSPEPRVTHHLVERKVGDLWIDPAVQRSLKKARVNKMAGDFHPEALGVLTTSYRAPNRIHVIDGQHRYRAAEAAGYAGAIQTQEYRGLTIPEEAAMFRLLNQTERVQAIDQFLVACVEQQPGAVGIAKILMDNGWSVGMSAVDGRLSAIRSLERVYAISPAAAAATISVLTAAYGHRPAAVQGSLVEGLGRMIARYGQDIDLTDLAKRLAGVAGGPDNLVGHARGQKLTQAGNLSTQVARVVTGIYNQRRRTTALPPWQ
jgi:hypothetical protein